MHDLNIDLETFSSIPIDKAGAQRYIASPDFEILLFAYSIDGAQVHCIDLAQGEVIPDWLTQQLDTEIDSLDKAFVAHLLGDSNTTDKARAVLEIRRELGKSSTKKTAVCPEGRVRGLLQF